MLQGTASSEGRAPHLPTPARRAPRGTTCERRSAGSARTRWSVTLRPPSLSATISAAAAVSGCEAVCCTGCPQASVQRLRPARQPVRYQLCGRALVGDWSVWGSVTKGWAVQPAAVHSLCSETRGCPCAGSQTQGLSREPAQSGWALAPLLRTQAACRAAGRDHHSCSMEAARGSSRCALWHSRDGRRAHAGPAPARRLARLRLVGMECSSGQRIRLRSPGAVGGASGDRRLALFAARRAERSPAGPSRLLHLPRASLLQKGSG